MSASRLKSQLLHHCHNHTGASSIHECFHPLAKQSVHSRIVLQHQTLVKLRKHLIAKTWGSLYMQMWVVLGTGDALMQMPFLGLLISVVWLAAAVSVSATTKN